MMDKLEGKLEVAWWALRLGVGSAAFLAGLDKYFNLLANWEMYMSPLAERLLPVAPATFLHIAGVIEMAVGLSILFRWTRIGAYVASAWLLAIAANLVSTGMFFDIAVRDIEMALGAFTLAALTEVRESRAAAAAQARATAARPHGAGAKA